MGNKYDILARRKELDRLVRERAWGKFYDHFVELSSNKDDCRLVVESCNRQTTHRTLLHFICDLESNRPPSLYVALVATACCEALFISDSKQRLPIHLAIRCNAGLDTIKALVKSIPVDHYVYKREKMLLHSDWAALSPLLLASKMDSLSNKEEIIKYLVNEDTTGQSLLVQKNAQELKQCKSRSPLRFIAAEEISLVEDGLSSEGLLRFMIIRTYISRMKEIMKNVYNSSFDADGAMICLLQATIVCHDMFGSTKLATSILSTVIICNDSFDPKHRDSLQNSTLHIASLSSTQKFERVLKFDASSCENCDLMTYLIKYNTSSFTKFIVRNKFGDIPLHCAIRTGKSSLTAQLLEAYGQSAKIKTLQGELPIHLALKCGSTQHTIMMLWYAYPEAVLVPDQSTALYPFQLAAVFGCENDHIPRRYVPLHFKRNKKRITNYCDDELTDLTLTYFFLREHPGVITFFH